MEAKAPIIKLDPEREILPVQPDINAAYLAAYKLITQNTNGHIVEVNMGTENQYRGFWRRRVVSQRFMFKVEITVDVKEEQK
jgi:hypothetical protein